MLGPHKHYNKQATYHTVWLSRRFSYANLWALWIHIIWTHYVPLLRPSSPRISNYAYSDGQTGTGGNFRLSRTMVRHICMAQSYNTTTETTWQLLCTKWLVYVAVSFTAQGSPTCGHKPAGDTHHFMFYYVWPANQQPTITGVDLCHKNFGRPWFTETHVIRYQPFALDHYVRFHFESYTSDKHSNKTCEINTIPPTNIQYHKIHVRNWIRSQTSHWYTNRMKWTWGEKMQPTAVHTTQLHNQANTAMAS
jgi:hypothetical protein